MSADDTKIIFNNMSSIEIIPTKDDVVRGKRAEKPIPDGADCLISQEIVDEVLKPFTNEVRNQPAKRVD
ncbi:MAG: hypothetical protein KH230_13700 [Enterocloster asparagiformis]|nr:hypothetical protein [Enterocloster asparagiformis]